jgi:exodeoxyribonuclease V alpha subunit
MNCIGTYDGTIFYNPANKFCIVSVKTADQSVPAEARSNRRYKDHLIRFTAVGYEIPRTDAVELELDGEWAKGKYGVQLQVEQWREIVPRTKNGVEGYRNGTSTLEHEQSKDCAGGAGQNQGMVKAVYWRGLLLF